jgi:hypothetical protein
MCLELGLWLTAERVTLEEYHYDKRHTLIERDRRVSFRITGCLTSPLLGPTSLGRAHNAGQQEDEE